MSWKTEKESGEIPILLPYREMKTFVQGITGGTKLKHRDIIDKMTLEEKAAFLSGKNVWQTRDYSRLGLPSIFCSDGPHGIRKQAGAGDHLGLNASLPATCFPTAATVANSWDERLGEELGEALGEEAATQEVNVLLGPGLNMKRSPLCGRNFEYFSEDPYLAGKMAAAYVKGIQSQGVYACPKHFAVNSQELRRMAMNSVLDERTLREIYLTGFEIAVKRGQGEIHHDKLQRNQWHICQMKINIYYRRSCEKSGDLTGSSLQTGAHPTIMRQAWRRDPIWKCLRRDSIPQGKSCRQSKKRH